MATEIQKARAQAMGARKRVAEVEQDFIRKTIIALTGGGYGLARRKGLRKEVMGVPIKLAVATLATAGQVMSRGSSRRAFGAIADASIACFSENAMASGSFVAGIEDVGAVDDSSGGGI
jgi:hypothetical protein